MGCTMLNFQAASPKRCALFSHSCAELRNSLAAVGRRSTKSTRSFHKHLSPPPCNEAACTEVRAAVRVAASKANGKYGGGNPQVPRRSAQSWQNRQRHDLLQIMAQGFLPEPGVSIEPRQAQSLPAARAAPLPRTQIAEPYLRRLCSFLAMTVYEARSSESKMNIAGCSRTGSFRVGEADHPGPRSRRPRAAAALADMAMWSRLLPLCKISIGWLSANG